MSSYTRHRHGPLTPKALPIRQKTTVYPPAMGRMMRRDTVDKRLEGSSSPLNQSCGDDEVELWDEESFGSPSHLRSPSSVIFAAAPRLQGSPPGCTEAPRTGQFCFPKPGAPGRARPAGESALFKNVEPSGKSLSDSSRRQQTPLVNFNPFTPDSLLIQSATQQRNRRERTGMSEFCRL
ncbi:hypothetical protein KUCAC02_021934 [Chaenocephalus aceratus]|uniref:Uncharacterized protein n=1 Tax=Chaenocephalus aceratus TaxID=36190 RepID=A0ACB9XJ41_CHAAC|nr:hypothetical protein KUCAC02_021934 [Chaenocephalus aceratus]